MKPPPPTDCPDIPVPANRDRALGDYLANVYFEPQALADLAPDGRKRANIASAQSEDAVTWNVLAGLDSVEVPAVLPRDATATLAPAASEMIFWNRVAREHQGAPNLEAHLTAVMRACEANPRRASEVDAILWHRERRHLAFVEAKLTAGPGVCGAVRTSIPDLDKLERGRRGAGYECRLFRTSKAPRDNGCSYWGDGRGGAAFTDRFPRDLVAKHLGFQRPEPEREHEAACAIYYQLMRNVIVGNELAARLGDTSFEMIAVVAEKHYKPDYYKRFIEALGTDRNVDFKLVTWEAIGRALPEGHCVRLYIERHGLLGL